MTEEIQPIQKESVKLMKMSKGFQWEIKVLNDKITSEDLERLNLINNRLEEQYEPKGDNSGS